MLLLTKKLVTLPAQWELNSACIHRIPAVMALSTIGDPASKAWNMYAGGQARGARLMDITAECDGEQIMRQIMFGANVRANFHNCKTQSLQKHECCCPLYHTLAVFTQTCEHALAAWFSTDVPAV